MEVVKKVDINTAFGMYLALGPDRSLRKLIEKWKQDKNITGTALSTLARWSKDNNWVEKADKFDKEEHEQLMKLTLKKGLKSKINMINICRALLIKFGENIKTGGDYVPTMKDAEMAYKILKIELGEGLPDWEKVKVINLTAIFQQIFKNESDKTTKQDMDT